MILTADGGDDGVVFGFPAGPGRWAGVCAVLRRVGFLPAKKGHQHIFNLISRRYLLLISF
jgi:hypothetical protein